MCKTRFFSIRLEQAFAELKVLWIMYVHLWIVCYQIKNHEKVFALSHCRRFTALG